MCFLYEGVEYRAHIADAYHIAAASIVGLDFIVSLNFKRSVKRKTIIKTEIINRVVRKLQFSEQLPYETAKYRVFCWTCETTNQVVEQVQC